MQFIKDVKYIQIYIHIVAYKFTNTFAFPSTYIHVHRYHTQKHTHITQMQTESTQSLPICLFIPEAIEMYTKPAVTTPILIGK